MVLFISCAAIWANIVLQWFNCQNCKCKSLVLSHAMCQFGIFVAQKCISESLFILSYIWNKDFETIDASKEKHLGMFLVFKWVEWWGFFLYRGTKSERQKRLSWSRQANIWRRYTKEKETQRRVRHTQSQLWWLCLDTSWIFRKLMLPKLMCLDGERC